MIKNILFDLDGTLTDSSQGITKSVRYALEKKGYKNIDADELKSFIGPPLAKMFVSYMGLKDLAEGQKMVEIYREYYKDKGIYENTVYDKIPETLKILNEKGYSLFVATSKPTVFSVKILEKHDLLKYFVCVSGCELDGTRDSKKEVIEYLLNNYDINPEETVMVGDRIYDVEGAKSLGIKSIGVTFGFGSVEEFKDAEYIAENPLEIVNCVEEMQINGRSL